SYVAEEPVLGAEEGLSDASRKGDQDNQHADASGEESHPVGEEKLRRAHGDSADDDAADGAEPADHDHGEDGEAQIGGEPLSANNLLVEGIEDSGRPGQRT